MASGFPRPGNRVMASEDASRRAVDFAVARTSLSREEAYMLLSIIGELRIGTSPRPVMATRLNRPRGAVAGSWLERRAAIELSAIIIFLPAPSRANCSGRKHPEQGRECPGLLGHSGRFA